MENRKINLEMCTSRLYICSAIGIDGNHKSNKMKQIFLIINNGNVLQAFEDKTEAVNYKEVEEKIKGCQFDLVTMDLHTKKDSIRRRKESKRIFDNLIEGITTDIKY